MGKYPEIITEQFLNDHPECVFVFGDNTIHQGMGGAAALRFHPQAIGFVTKIFPDMEDSSFYTPENYPSVYLEEVKKLREFAIAHPEKKILISKLGAGLANLYGIWEDIIKPTLPILLKGLDNIEYLW